MTTLSDMMTTIPSDNQVTINGEMLRALRDQRGLTQEDLAHRIGISRSYIAEMERGNRRPRVLVAKALARSLQTPLEDLLQ